MSAPALVSSERHMNALRRWWTREDSRFVLRTKQFISSVIPEPLLLAAKKRYYYQILKNLRTGGGEKEMRALPQIIKSDDFVIDIGANIGIYTKALTSLVGLGGMVWSIEPMPQTFAILKYLIQKNGWQNVTPFNVAISDSCGSVEMEIPRWKGGGESWYDARIFSADTRHANWRVVSAQSVTLDSLTKDVDRPISFIKCDTEFHELACLHGARETIARCIRLGSSKRWTITTRRPQTQRIFPNSSRISDIRPTCSTGRIFSRGQRTQKARTLSSFTVAERSAAISQLQSLPKSLVPMLYER